MERADEVMRLIFFSCVFFFLSSFHHLIGIRSCVDFLKVLSCSVYRNLLLRCLCMYVCVSVCTSPFECRAEKGERERKTGKLSTKYVVHSGTLDGIWCFLLVTKWFVCVNCLTLLLPFCFGITACHRHCILSLHGKHTKYTNRIKPDCQWMRYAIENHAHNYTEPFASFLL